MLYNMFNIKHIIFSLCFLFFIDTSSPFNININNSRRNFIAKSLASSKIINLSAKNNEPMQQAFNEESNNKYLKNNNIYFTGQLNEETCFHLNEALIKHKNLALTQQDYPNHINLYIQSPGGSLLPTLGLVDEIINLGIPVNTYIRGYAASAATLLSVIGSQRYMYNHSVLMIHSVKLNDQQPSSLLDVKDLNINVDVFMDIVKNIYLENSNIDSKILDEFFKHDIWMNSTTALKYGLIDEII